VCARHPSPLTRNVYHRSAHLHSSVVVCEWLPRAAHLVRGITTVACPIISPLTQRRRRSLEAVSDALSDVSFVW